MGRGKDGYTSLLIEEEGGSAVEVVSEENGVLISTILRQFFMSLKVLGKWKHWGKSMDRKFLNIQTNMEQNHAFIAASLASPNTTQKQQQLPPPASDQTNDAPKSENFGLENSDEDEDDGAVYDDSKPILFNEEQTKIIRRVMRKWWRLAKLEGSPKLCDELGEGEFQVNWTRAVAPRLEGRIKEVKKSE